MISKFEKKALHLFVGLVEMNPLMCNIKDLGYKQRPGIRLKIVVQTDKIYFGMYS